MNGMNTQERYDDIARLSGLSEDIIRRVLKASRQSLVKSLKKGERSTLPGLCTIYPELRSCIKIGGTSSDTFIKLRAKPSSALDTEMEKISKFSSKEDEDRARDAEEKGLNSLNFVRDKKSFDSPQGVRTSQISALL